MPVSEQEPLMNESVHAAARRRAHPYPARSKMLDVYATDIAMLLTDGRYDAAERSAIAIPHIAVSLQDAGLQSSLVAYQNWCATWVQPDFGAAVYQDWCVRSGECSTEGAGLPFAALRALRLSRRAREVHSVSTLSPADLNNAEAHAHALLGAVSRWYEQEGRYDPVVQTNLARLGVLR
jgi:hypothetical protein